MIKNLIDWAIINKNPAPFHVYLTPRKRGKTDHKVQLFLKEIYNNKKNIDNKGVLYCWIRRRWKDSSNCSRPLFEQNIHSFCEETGSKIGDWEVKEKGVWYLRVRRIYFVDLFSFQKERGAIAQVRFEELIFDEAIPIDGEFLRLGENDEQWIFGDLLDSLKRKSKNIKITFLANDYFWSSWFLDFFDEGKGKLITIKKRALILKEENDNAGVLQTTTWKDIRNKENKGEVEWLFYVNLIEGEYDAQSAALKAKTNPFLVNWDDYMLPLFTKTGNLKKYQIEHAIQDYFFCELGEREKNKKYFLMHFSKNQKERVDQNTVNFCFNLEEKAKSKFAECLLRPKEKLIHNWVNMLKEGELYFSDFRARDWFLEQIKGC